MHFFPHKIAMYWSAKKRRKDTFFPLFSPFPGNFRNSKFNFHRYTQREAMPTQKPARRWHLATFCAKDYKGHSLVQTSFTEPPDTQLTSRRRVSAKDLTRDICSSCRLEMRVLSWRTLSTSFCRCFVAECISSTRFSSFADILSIRRRSCSSADAATTQEVTSWSVG